MPAFAKKIRVAVKYLLIFRNISFRKGINLGHYSRFTLFYFLEGCSLSFVFWKENLKTLFVIQNKGMEVFIFL